VQGKFHAPVMTTADLALKFDPAYKEIAERFLANPDMYQQAFAKAWFKLTHRDMGPRGLYLGAEVPADELIWQDPVPAPNARPLSSYAVRMLKKRILDSGLTVPQLVRTAWASASTFRASDKRGGANGARIALAPQKDWAANNPRDLAAVLAKLEEIRTDYGAAKISLADMIVLGGAAAIEQAASAAGAKLQVPFQSGRGDTTQDRTDVNSFALLEPTADAFRNYYNASTAYRSPVEMMVDKADQLNLSVPEMTVLMGGMRVLNANADGSAHGVFTDAPGTLSNDFFVNLLDMGTQWSKADADGLYQGVDRSTGKALYTATPVDLIFGSNTELRAIAEAYAFNGAQERFANDFVSAWVKVMRADRFDLK
jgi:catalase-peroxidase